MVMPRDLADLGGQLDLEQRISGTLPVDNGGVSIDPYTAAILNRFARGSFTGLTLVSDTAYFVYLGRTPRVTTYHYVTFFVSTAGSGAQTAEVGLFSTTSFSFAANVTMTKVVASGSVSALTSTGAKSNSSTFNTNIPAGTHLWAGIRTAMATTQPAIHGLYGHHNQGSLRSTAAAGALTGAGPWTAARIDSATTGLAAVAPDLAGMSINA